MKFRPRRDLRTCQGPHELQRGEHQCDECGRPLGLYDGIHMHLCEGDTQGRWNSAVECNRVLLCDVCIAEYVAYVKLEEIVGV